jgi:hypothetical protein
MLKLMACLSFGPRQQRFYTDTATQKLSGHHARYCAPGPRGWYWHIPAIVDRIVDGQTAS